MNAVIKYDLPLVSIIVITYNSSKYVLETLESAKAQTYRNIELIVSDDGSKDNTIEICRQWIEENKGIFTQAELITTPINTGIPANCNRGMKVSQGIWAKLIAGDDILLPNCIDDNIKYIIEHPHCKIVQSNCRIYLNEINNNSLLNIKEYRNKLFLSDNIDAQTQHKILIYNNSVSAVAVFLKKSLLETLGGYDNCVKLFEDLPMWLKITEAGYKIYYMNKVTVGYRQNSESVMHNMENGLFNYNFIKDRELVNLKYIYSYKSFFGKLLHHLRFKTYYLLNLLKMNNDTFIPKMILSMTLRINSLYVSLQLKKIEKSYNIFKSNS